MNYRIQRKTLFLLVIAAFSYCAYAGNSRIGLFNAFPDLEKNLPHVDICDLPTPIFELDRFGEFVGHDQIYMKVDFLTGKAINNGEGHLYGGNKPRKLEFLLADAAAKGAKTIITYGCAGSNHALATAVYAKELGFPYCILMLKDQPNSPIVRQNLLLDRYYGADLRFFQTVQARSAATDEILKNDPTAYLIPTGGSNEIGAVGFVNAAFELREQIQNGIIAEPDYIYIALGSCGTVAGLLLGLQAAGLQSKVVAVAVEPGEARSLKPLFEKTNKFLREYDASFPTFSFPDNQLVINKKYAGTHYGLFTPEASNATKLFYQFERVKLEGTYSAKPVAAIIDDAASGLLAGKTVLFWDTYCGIDYSDLTKGVNYKELPVEFHKYFEEDIQPLSVGMYEL
jgi:1-aminocyclopropane-1-carboxylate deaminase/D-cysteine desulfhydrase-like pyridoxal-dependent ACC family enzyme